MHTKAPHEQFYRYVIPAMASQLLTGFFIIVDGFFIGQSIGDVGLASINILWPIAAVILATGLGIGSGGSVVMTHAMGAGDTEKALAARGNTLLCLGAATVLLTAALGLSYPWLLRLLGATGELYQPAADYTVVVVLAGGLQIFNSGLNPLLRGSGRTVAAMAIMIFSLLCNILLDWLFIAVFAWGMRGAALATVTAQGLSALAALLCLLMNKNAPVHARQFCPIRACAKNCLRWAFLRLGFPCPPVCSSCSTTGSASVTAARALLLPTPSSVMYWGRCSRFCPVSARASSRW